MSKRLKTPSDYDQFYFRIDSETKNIIEDQILTVLTSFNELKKPEYKLLKRNQVIAMALLHGLKAITKTLDKKMVQKSTGRYKKT